MLNAQIIILFASILILIISLIFLGISIYIKISDANKKKACTQKADGAVTDVIKNEITGNIGEASMYSWIPVFTYKVNGQEISKRSIYGAERQMFYIGQKVTVYYNPDDINDYYVLEEKNISKIQKLFFIISMILIIVSMMCILALLYIKGVM